MVEVKNIKVEDLQEYEANPRKNEKAVDAVEASIKEFGFKNPIIINQQKEILAGHTRLAASKKLGLKEVPCIIISDLDEEQEKAFRIADNRTAEFSSWDTELLATEMESIGDVDWEDFGFKKKDLKILQPPNECKCPRCGKTFIKVD